MNDTQSIPPATKPNVTSVCVPAIQTLFCLDLYAPTFSTYAIRAASLILHQPLPINFWMAIKFHVTPEKGRTPSERLTSSHPI